MRALVIDTFTETATARVADAADPAPGDGVLIEVHAAGLGFPDALIAQGRYQVKPTLPFIPGMEISGVVRSAPAESLSLVGRRVVALTGVTGGCAELAVVPSAFVYPAPEDETAWATGALVVNYHTAYFALVRRGKLEPGQTVLVQGAGGGVGQATIQVAKALGGYVIAVASTPERQQAAATAGADEVIPGDESWTSRVRDLTDNRGVELVIDPVGGQRFVESLRLLATEGRLVVVGFASGEIPQAKANRLLLQNTSVIGAAWREYVDRDPDYGQTMARELNAMWNAGVLASPVTVTFPLERSTQAMTEIVENQTIGRLSVSMPTHGRRAC